ncbi:ATP-binding cassette domain-containing protein [Corynebacterium halotolerans]|uniref:ATP-binding cassette domain-containing protein n=1 Tax=Corynebacterium halotolerans TaxID=225326 RepID=UPI003CFA85E0
MPTSPITHAQLSARQLCIRRGGRTLIEGLSFTAAPGSVTAVVGENGRGKTSLLHTLAGRFDPQGGEIIRQGSLALAEQEMSVATGSTVGDAVDVAAAPARAALSALELAGAALTEERPGAESEFAAALDRVERIDAWGVERRIQVALEALAAETDFRVPLAGLSVGQRYRVRLACLLGGSDPLLLLDEPTNHLDRDSLDFLTGSLLGRRGATVLVSHDRALLADVADTVIDLDPTPDGRPRVYGDGYAGYRSGRAAMLARWEQEYRSEQARRGELEHSREQARSRLHTGWRPPKGTGKHTRAMRTEGVVQAVRRRQAQLEECAVDVPEPPRQLRFPDLAAPAGVPLLDACEVTVAGRLDTPVSLTVRGGEKWVVTGANGAGKSTLLQLLAGTLLPDRGQITRTAAAGVLAQESERPPAGTDRALALGLLSSAEARRPLRDMSLGQLRRLDLADALSGAPQVLLLDEPTNHLSARLVDELTAALRVTSAAVVVVTHDRQLLNDTADWHRLELGGRQ